MHLIYDGASKSAPLIYAIIIISIICLDKLYFYWSEWEGLSLPGVSQPPGFLTPNTWCLNPAFDQWLPVQWRLLSATANQAIASIISPLDY